MSDSILEIEPELFRPVFKTGIVKAKPISAVFADCSILDKFLIRTLEGNQPLRKNSAICVGVQGEVWQQSFNSLFSEYDTKSYDDKGWIIFTPKKELYRLAYQVPIESCDSAGLFSVKCKWRDGDIVTGTYLQDGKAGDYVILHPHEQDDPWIVANFVFDSTYEWGVPNGTGHEKDEQEN